jgi:hypothetical protein
MRITFGNPPNRHDVRRPLRTYVVVGYPRALRAGDPVTVVGTVRALNRAAAGPLALALARRRGRPTRPPTLTPGWAVGWCAACTCRRSWLLAALARDGAALLAASQPSAET